jgi:hypothetical protein
MEDLTRRSTTGLKRRPTAGLTRRPLTGSACTRRRHTQVEEAHRWRALRMMMRRSARAQHRVELKQVVLEEEEGRRRFSRWRKVRGRRFSGSRVAELIFWGLDPEAAGDDNFSED